MTYILLCRCRADELLADAEGRGFEVHDDLREPSSVIVLSFSYKTSYKTL